ncbi:caspase inhibitor [Spilosoma obliqua nucleopolyhedrosis virus]|uniref:P49 n=1 Tax=Hyphantria cunea nuclear polyhedrosis virus TaxID=28288 RepID=Q2NNT2_NPVHC|nr:P49 [Hyphantria cunea nucleopolyhedrovirus]AUR45045.1 caspase inhibitor [Spilosoma obliqua nucleopolyhedrosis virus]BAE72304.1 P49 [Hyphantria cunea nucleopolyhedrovirus]
MSGDDLIALPQDKFKYLFLGSYFDLKNFDRVPSDAKPFIGNYLDCNFRVLDDDTLQNYIGYLRSIQLRHIINGPLTPDVYKFIKPQFRFVCNRATVDILEFDSRIYIKPGTPVYATNFFTSNPAKMSTFIYSHFRMVYKSRLFANNSNNGCVLGGAAGFVFDDAYVDWGGVRMCAAPRLENNRHPFRLYLLGEEMAAHFMTNNILPPHPNNALRVNNGVFMLKNFYKGLPMYLLQYQVVNSIKFTTRKPNELFNEIDKELNSHSPFVKLIQRDYIYDAQFPNDLLEVLNEYMTKSSIMKFITKFAIEENASANDMLREIVFDRYAVDSYRKLYIKMELVNVFPAMYDNESAYLFINKDLLQLTGTLNAFYAPKMRILSILSVNRLFGATETLDYHPNLLVYRQSSPPVRLTGDVYAVDKSKNIFLVKHTFSNTVPAYLLIRGDYESSSALKSLRDLNPWVQNTLLELLIVDGPTVAAANTTKSKFVKAK